MFCIKSLILLIGLFVLHGCKSDQNTRFLLDIYSGQDKAQVVEKDREYESHLLKYGEDTLAVTYIFCDNKLRGLFIENLTYPRNNSFSRIINSLSDSAGKFVRVELIDDYPRVVFDPDSAIYVYDTRHVYIEDGVFNCD